MNIKKSAASLFLAGIIMSSSVFSYAANFKDMKDAKGKAHWSLQYVNEISQKGLVSGYSDGTFKPNKPVSRIESIVFISRFFPKETVNNVYNLNKARWKTELDKHLIPEFARPAIVFGLENRWYAQAYLKEFMNPTTKSQKEAKRYEFAVYLVRALGWDDEMSKAAVVAYKDVNSIPKQAIPYIEVLGKKGIVVKTGEFNPQKSVTRAEVAKMLSIALNLFNKNTENTPVQPNQPVKPVDPNNIVMPSGKVVEGTIRQVTVDNYNAIITIVDNYGNVNMFTNRTSGVVVVRDKKSYNINQIKEGQVVKLYTEGTTLKGVEVVSDKEIVQATNKNFSGEVVSINANKNSIKIKDGRVVEEYDILASADITKNGRPAKIYDISLGDNVNVQVKNSVIVSLDAKTVKRVFKNAVIKGITSYANGTASVVIEDEDGQRHNMEYTQDSVTYRNSKVEGLSALAVGYEVDVYANSNQILDITVFGRTQGTVITGVITYINTREDSIYVETKDRKEVRVIIDRNAAIVNQITNRTMSIYDLEVGKNVILNGYDGANVFEATRVAFY